MTDAHDAVAAYNKRAWNNLVAGSNTWTVPVAADVIAKARRGELSLLLTPTKPVPAEWLGHLKGKRVLGLACGGGQQGPCLAAAGATVTILDNAPAQLAQDQGVAEREGLTLETIEGDMRDLSMFANETFDLIFHPCSNCFVPDVRPVWREAHRVLKRGGTVLTGIVNPVVFMLDLAKERQGIAQLKYKQPFSATEQADDPEIKDLRNKGEPLDFGHTLTDQIAGQLDAGFTLTGFYEDNWPDDPSPIQRLMKPYIATRAVKA